MAPTLVDLLFSLPETANPFAVFFTAVIAIIFDVLTAPLTSFIRILLGGALDLAA